MTPREKRVAGLAGLVFVVAAGLPFVDTGFWLTTGVSLAMYTVLATSWALFSGPTHYISLATAAFFGIGMYVAAIGIDFLPYPLLILIAAVVGAGFAAVVGLATLRLSGVYFVIFTLGLAELVRQLVAWVQTTMGTSSGLYVLTGVTESIIYWILLGFAVLVYLIGWRIGRSRLGFALRIIGNDETVAAHVGIGTARAKILLFMISCAFAAATGAVLAPRWSYVEPTVAFSPMISFLVVIMALLGGAHRLWGPLLGVVPFTLLWDLISAQVPNQATLLLGVAFLLIVYLIPNGVVGILERTLRKQGRAGHG